MLRRLIEMYDSTARTYTLVSSDGKGKGRDLVAAARICAEYLGSVRWQVALVSVVQSADFQWPIKSEKRLGVERESVRDEHRAVLGDRDEAGVERRIEMRRQQKAV